MHNSPDITIIVPAYNAGGKIHAALDSIRRLDFEDLTYEAIIVDDCSSDNTVEIVREYLAVLKNWKLVELSENSGSPSRPRNKGIELAAADYVYFHDADDELLPSGLAKVLAFAKRSNADIVRGSLLVQDDLGVPFVRNQITDLDEPQASRDVARSIIRSQSSVPAAVIRKEFLESNDIRWREDIRMGEDTIFLARILSNADVIRYVDVPTYIYDRRVQGERSSTQEYTDSALSNHLEVWTSVQSELARVGIDYIDERGTVAVREALLSLYSRRQGTIREETYSRFRDFINFHDQLIQDSTFKPRVRQLYETVRDEDYAAFLEAIKPRLLIAGYDLKFILGAIPHLTDSFQISVDEWSGHETHNVAQSRRLLDWADVVFCDWLLGNATWYSKNVREDQVLVARGHRFELGRDFGFDPSLTRLDRFYSVSVKTLEDFIRTFDISRQQARLLPNWVDVDAFHSTSSDGRQYRIGLIGSVPKRKGLLRALRVLARLRQKDARFTLDIYGRRAEELEWIWRDPEERAYFAECDEFIAGAGLDEAIRYHGWTDMRAALADTGWVLSVSEDESFHLAPSEGFASGAQGLLLNWPGARYIYPERFVFDEESDMVAYIENNLDFDVFSEGAEIGRRWVSNRFGVGQFANALTADLSRLISIRSMR